jgi:GNAT superfamily N-acetyltransferase
MADIVRSADDPGYFGDEDHVAVQRRAHRLWPFLQHDPRLCHTGRNIAVSGPALADVDKFAALTHELGVLGNEFLEDEIKDTYVTALEDRGLKVAQFNIFVSDERTYERSKRILADRRLPEGLRIVEIGHDSDPTQVQAFQRLNEECGVATLPRYVLRGEAMPVMARGVVDGKGEVVATAGCVARHPPGSLRSGSIFTGFLATRPDLRGQGLAGIVFAHVNLAAYERLGATLLYAGVRPGNVPSQAACRAAGLDMSRWWFVVATSSERFDGEFTR